MGAFQSVGGAATSGQGLSGDQITSAIVAALLHTKYQGIQNDGTGRPTTPSSDGSRRASETMPEREFNREQTSACPYVTKERNVAARIEVTEYAPVIFHALRSLGGTSDDEFLAEWDLFPTATATVKRAMRGALGPEGEAALPVSPNAGQPQEEGNLELGEGRSMALFLKSKSMAFMCKTISETEVQVLVTTLRKYLQHVERNVDSMLMRFVMLLRISVTTNKYGMDSAKYNGFSPLTVDDFSGQKPIQTGTEVGYVLCFNDCFSNCDVLHERWDLKGRHPKPGKFRHFPAHQLYRNRVVQPKVKQNAREQQSVFGDDAGNTNRNTHRDHNRFSNLDTADGADDERRQQADLSSEEEDDGQTNLRSDKTLDKMRLNTRKDKDLARLFWLEPADREYLIQQITADFEFLLACGLMDYSILIGVRYNTSEEQLEKEHIRRGNSANSLPGANYTPRNGEAPRNVKGALSAMKMPFVMGEENNAGIIEVRPTSPNAQGNKKVKQMPTHNSEDAADGYGNTVSSTSSQQNQRQYPNQFSMASAHSADQPVPESLLDDFHSQFHQGVDSVECVETYYIGIIDMLTVYNGKKKTANFCKKFLWQENTLSTIPPKKYAERIEKYAHRIFPKVAIEEHASSKPTGPQMQELAIGRGKVSTHAAGFKVAKEISRSKKSKDILVAPSSR